MASQKKFTAWPWGLAVGIMVVVLALLWTTWPRGSPRVPPGGLPPLSPTLGPPGAAVVVPADRNLSVSGAATATLPTLPVVPRVVIPAKDALTVAVLNGSGTAGAAGQVAEVFRGAGYVNVTAGNADAYSYRGTTIRYRPGLRGAAEDLARLLREQSTQFIYQEYSTSTPPADVVVIVGQ